MRDLIHNELLLRLDNLVDDIRFQKEQQWKAAYYTILIYGAFIAIFQLNVELSPKLYITCKIISYVLIAVITIIVSIYQRALHRILKEYRNREKIIRRLLINFERNLQRMQNRGVATLIDDIYHKFKAILKMFNAKKRKVLKRRERSRRMRRPEWYFILFISLNIIGAIITYIIIFHDK